MTVSNDDRGTATPVRRRLADRRPPVLVIAGGYTERLQIPSDKLVMPDGNNYAGQVRAVVSRGRDPHVQPVELPLWLRRSWPEPAAMTLLLVAVAAMFILGDDKPRMTSAYGWMLAISFPIMAAAGVQALFRAWWGRADTRQWLSNDLSYLASPKPDKSEAAALWRQAVLVVIRVNRTSGPQAAEPLERHLQKLYPLLCRMHALAQIGVHTLNRMDRQRASYEQLKADAEQLIAGLLDDADASLAPQQRQPWTADGAGEPEPHLIRENDLR